MLICSFCLFVCFFSVFFFCFVLFFVCLYLFCFICQTASIFYSLAFQILLPEIFFPHSRSNEGKSSYAIPSTIFKGIEIIFRGRCRPRKIIAMFLRQNRENLATRKYPILRYLDGINSLV